MKVFLGGLQGTIEERIGDIPSAENPECEQERFYAHVFPHLGMNPDIPPEI
jgi:hypothetical protein